MKLYIAENNLRDYLGHFFNMAAGLKHAFENLGIATHVLMHQNASPDVCHALHGKAIFPHCFWDSGQHANAKVAMQTYGAQFAHALSAIETIDRDDWLLVTTAFQDQVFGVAAYLETLLPDHRPRVLCYVHWSNWQDRPDRIAAWQDACKRLATAAGAGRFIFAAQTRPLVEAFTHMSGYSAVTWPVPMNYGPRQVLEPRRDHTPVRVAALGRNLHRKGSHQLPEVLMGVKLRYPQTRFSIQVSDNMSKLAYLRFFPGIEVLEGANTLSEHLDIIRRSDILLLPYRAEDYVNRSSGLMMEGAAFGRVMVVPQGTWLSQQIKQGRAAGTTFAGHSAKTIAQALILALQTLPRLSEKALACADYWWEYQSASAFVHQLLAHGSTRNRPLVATRR